MKATPRIFDNFDPAPLKTAVSLERVEVKTILNTKTGIECPRPKTASIKPALRGVDDVKSDAITTGSTNAKLQDPKAIDTTNPKTKLAMI